MYEGEWANGKENGICFSNIIFTCKVDYLWFAV